MDAREQFQSLVRQIGAELEPTLCKYVADESIIELTRALVEAVALILATAPKPVRTGVYNTLAQLTEAQADQFDALSAMRFGPKGPTAH